MNYLLDTNAIIYLLKGRAKSLPFSNDDKILISFITKIELLSHQGTPDEEDKIQTLLNYYDILFIDDQLINKTIDIRKNHNLKLPDSIIVATAIQEKATLITADKEIIKKSSDISINIIDPLTGESF